MQYEFLKNFPKRMKNVGLYGVLIQNSIQKTSWKQFGFLKFDEQMNLIFVVMLYIMEQSLREENCTMDDIEAQRESEMYRSIFIRSKPRGNIRLHGKRFPETQVASPSIIVLTIYMC